MEALKRPLQIFHLKWRKNLLGAWRRQLNLSQQTRIFYEILQLNFIKLFQTTIWSNELSLPIPFTVKAASSQCHF
jgi:hypothetical protein